MASCFGRHLVEAPQSLHVTKDHNTALRSLALLVHGREHHFSEMQQELDSGLNFYESIDMVTEAGGCSVAATGDGSGASMQA